MSSNIIIGPSAEKHYGPIVNKPSLITVEGLSCVGKTTLCNNLISDLERNLIPCKYIKVLPSQTKRGEAIRALPKDLDPFLIDLMYLSDFYSSLEEANHELKAGKVVVMDRYLPSLLSFCEVYRAPEDFAAFEKIIDYSKIPQPDIMFFLSASQETRNRRANKKNDMSQFDWKSLESKSLEDSIKRYSRMYSPIKINTDNLDEIKVLNSCLSYLNGHSRGKNESKL